VTERVITAADIVRLKAKLGPDIDEWFEGLEVLDPGPDPVPDPPVVAWSSGAFTMHQPATLAAMGTWRGKPMANAAVFPTYRSGADKPDQLADTWWIKAAAGVPDVSIGMPMCLEGGSISTDLSPQFRKMATAMKATGQRWFIRLGWEMNLPQQPWKVTDANLSLWRQRWAQYYDLFRGILADKGLVGFNPNIAENQSGLSGSILRAWVDGKVDWCGPDVYDCWPAFTSDANVATQMNRNQGLNWWASTAALKGVPLAVPEWGVSSGTQWPKEQIGRDNPRYVSDMRAFFERVRKQLLFESYFNEQAGYVASDIFRPGAKASNPLAGDRYRQLFGA